MQYVRTHYSNVGAPRIAATLGRSQNAVIHMARKLCVRAEYRPGWSGWTDAELNYVREHYPTTSASKIAKALGRGEDGVKHMAQKLGVQAVSRPGNMPVAWTEERRARYRDRVEKHCWSCKTVKPMEQFHNRSRGLDGKSDICKDCSNAKSLLVKRRNSQDYRPRRRAYKLERKYGITHEIYDAMWAEQEGRCKICRIQMVPNDVGHRKSPEKATIDHCHATGVVRGLLCDWCNRGLGLMRENVESLLAAARYLADAPSGSWVERPAN